MLWNSLNSKWRNLYNKIYFLPKKLFRGWLQFPTNTLNVSCDGFATRYGLPLYLSKVYLTSRWVDTLVTYFAPLEQSRPERWFFLLFILSMNLHTVGLGLGKCLGGNHISSELCALVNKPSGASAGASDQKYKRLSLPKTSGASAGAI